ncbi:MAG: DUF2723 domain-containing protein, partial [Acidobacteria bacterium]|nr:DUF2723 domain-containing protein [Acidobacteriota bacterium]
MAFALGHLAYLPSTLEDIDSVNFALGIRDFDVANHRPHPPGYPIYIALGKVGVAIATPFAGGASASSIEARTLSALSLLAALGAIFWLHRVFASWSSSPARPDLIAPPWHEFDPRPLAATALAVASPLFWYLAVRPMSDVPGLAVALAAQTCLALAWWRQQGDAVGDRRLSPNRVEASGRMIVLGALLTGLAMGVRSQNAMLTVPLLLGVLIDRIGRGVGGAMVGGAVAFSTGVMVWAVPLMFASGGMDAYLAALGSQAGEDFAGVDMLYRNPEPRLAAMALMRTLIHPWDSLVLGGIVVTLAVFGIVALALRDRRALIVVALVSLPYLAFHLLFQDTAYVRYGLPLVPPVAFLAVCGAELVARRGALVVIGAVALGAVASAAPVLMAYASEASPTVRALRAMDAARGEATPGALAMHQTFRRPLEAEDVSVQPVLDAPPRREWLELARYWREGNTAPLWFLADPRRSDLALIDPRSRVDRVDFLWPFASLSELGGMRPAAAHWYRLPAPGWFAEEGWALTPETAGIAGLMGRGPSLGPIVARVRRRAEAVHVIVGGRHFGQSDDSPVTFRAAIDGKEAANWQVRPGFFVHEFDVAAGRLAGPGALAELTLQSEGGSGQARTAVEQFDLQPRGSLMWSYDTDWHEAEYSPTAGLWRWTAQRSTLRIVDARTPVVVTIRVERPRRYFDDDPTVRLLAGATVVGETTFEDSDLWSVTIPLDVMLA